MIAIVVSLPLLAFGWISIAITFSQVSGGVLVAGAIFGCGVGMLLLGIVLAVQSVTRRGEAFVVHENGFVRSWGNRSVEVLWADIVSITDNTKDNVFARFFEGHVGCDLRASGGRKVFVNGYTDGAELLVHRLNEGFRSCQ